MTRFTRLIGITFMVALAAPASAEFTDAEKDELGRIVRAMNTVGSTMKPLGDSMRDHTNDITRPLYYAAGIEVVDAGWECFQATRHLYNSGDTGFPAGWTRAEIVAQGFVHVANCHAELMAYADALDAVAAVQSNDNLPSFAASVRNNTTLDEFDTTLAYEGFLINEYPRIVGPHGDFDAGETSLEHAMGHSMAALGNIFAFYGKVEVFPQGAAVDVREAVRYWNEVFKHGFRAWGLEQHIEAVSQDTSRIDQDFAAASGLRPRSFFVPIRAAELILAHSKSHPVLFSGRKMDTGLTGLFNLAISEFPKAIGEATEVNTEAVMAEMWKGVKGGLNASDAVRRDNRMLLDFFNNLGESWAAFDSWATALLMFFHEIPPLPVPPGDLTCGPGTHQEGNVCVADPCPTCPPVVTCGAGTVEINGECVADVTCPEFEASIVLLSGTVAEARCVEVP